MNEQKNKHKACFELDIVYADFLKNQNEEQISFIMEELLPEYSEVMHTQLLIVLDTLRSIDKHSLYRKYGYQSMDDYCLAHLDCSIDFFKKLEKMMNRLYPEDLPDIRINLGEVYNY